MMPARCVSKRPANAMRWGIMSRALFDELIADEEGHIDFLETQLDLFDKLGEEKYEMLNAKPADQAE